jgi:hypothetical protein
MSTAIAISPTEIREIFQPRTANSLRLWDIAQKANALAVEVEDRWEEFPADKRKLLTTFAYAVIEPPQGIKGKFLDFVDRLSVVWTIGAIVLKREFNAFVFYAEAYQRLLNSILSAIEREDEDYQKALSEALEETFANVGNSKAMTAEEASERIRQISDRAFKDLCKDAAKTG